MPLTHSAGCLKAANRVPIDTVYYYRFPDLQAVIPGGTNDRSPIVMGWSIAGIVNQLNV